MSVTFHVWTDEPISMKFEKETACSLRKDRSHILSWKIETTKKYLENIPRALKLDDILHSLRENNAKTTYNSLIFNDALTSIEDQVTTITGYKLHIWGKIFVNTVIMTGMAKRENGIVSSYFDGFVFSAVRSENIIRHGHKQGHGHVPCSRESSPR